MNRKNEFGLDNDILENIEYWLATPPMHAGVYDKRSPCAERALHDCMSNALEHALIRCPEQPL